MISSVAALGGLLFGYDWVVIGGAKAFYENYFQLSSDKAIGWANSCALLGCLLGSILSGALGERFGRKKLLILSAVLFGVSSILTGWAFQFSSFVRGASLAASPSASRPTFRPPTSPRSAPLRGAAGW